MTRPFPHAAPSLTRAPAGSDPAPLPGAPAGWLDVGSGRYGRAIEHHWHPPGWDGSYLCIIAGMHDRTTVVADLRRGSGGGVGSSCQVAWRVRPEELRERLDEFLTALSDEGELPEPLRWVARLPRPVTLPDGVPDILHGSLARVHAPR